METASAPSPQPAVPFAPPSTVPGVLALPPAPVPAVDFPSLANCYCALHGAARS